MPPRRKWTEEEIMNFDSDQEAELWKSLPVGAASKNAHRGGRKKSHTGRALPRKRPLSVHEDEDSGAAGSDSETELVARDYAANLGAFGALRRDSGEESADESDLEAREPSKKKREEGADVAGPSSSLGGGAGAGVAALPFVPQAPLPFPVIGGPLRAGLGFTADLGALPPIDTLIRDPQLRGDSMSGDSDSDQDGRDLLEDGPIGEDLSDSSSMESDEEDGTEEEDEAAEYEEGEGEGDSDEALFRAILERRRSGHRAQGRGVDPAGPPGAAREDGDSDGASLGASDSDSHPSSVGFDLVNRTRPSKGSAKKRKRAKGAGQMLPGEKKKLRKEGIKAKRAARAAENGFDLASVNAELASMVHAGTDVYAFPPMDKHALKVVQKLSSLYGLKSGIQGSGKRRFLLVQNTKRACMPQGEAAAEVRLLLTLQEARQQLGKQGGGSLEERKAVARLAGVKGISATPNSGAKMAKQQGGAKGRQPADHSAPLSSRFVAAGTLQDVTEIKVTNLNAALQARRAAAAAVAAPAAAGEGVAAAAVGDVSMGAAAGAVGGAVQEGSQGAMEVEGQAVGGAGRQRADPVASSAGRVQEFNRWAATHQVAKEGAASAAAALEAFEMSVDRGEGGGKGRERAGLAASGAGKKPVQVLYERISGIELGGSGLGFDPTAALDPEDQAGPSSLPFPDALHPPLASKASSGDRPTDSPALGGSGLGSGLGFRFNFLPAAPATMQAEEEEEADEAAHPPTEQFPFQPNKKAVRALREQREREASSRKGKGKGKKGKGGTGGIERERSGRAGREPVQGEEAPVLLPTLDLSAYGFGAWERHTGGFGSRMLAKMGFDGRGLGKKRDGRMEPIQVEMRAKRQGLGADV